MKIVVQLLCFLLSSCLVLPTLAGEWTPDQREILEAMARLSATTAPDGAGAEAYADVLADDFTRWTLGSDVIDDKKSWVEGVGEWFDDGWRVVDRKVRILGITIDGSRAFVRRIVHETYEGPEGDRSSSRAALAELWVRDGNAWLLYRVDADVLDAN